MNRPHLKQALRWGFVALTVGLLVFALYRQWDDFTDAIKRVSALSVIAAAIAVVLSLCVNMLSWRASISAVAHQLPLPAAARVYFVSQLGKYVPGSVWPVVVQTEMGRAHGVSRTRSAIGSVLAMVIGLATSVIVASGLLLFLRRDALEKYWYLGVVALGCVVVLIPPVLRRMLGIAMRVTGRGGNPADISISGRHLAYALLWATLVWLFSGMQAWLIARQLAPGAENLLAWSIGAFALAWAVGFVVVFAPGGLGAREIALVFALSSVMPRGDALALALISRVLMTIGDLGGAALAIVVARRHGGATPTAASNGEAIPTAASNGEATPTAASNGEAGH